MLAENYGVHSESFGQQLADVAGKLVQSYTDHQKIFLRWNQVEKYIDPIMPVHFIVPYIILGTGRGIRSLGIDHQLIRVTVFVQPCRCDQKFCPVLPLSRKAVCRFAGKCKIFFGFVWHLKPPFGFRIQKERAAVS